MYNSVFYKCYSKLGVLDVCKLVFTRRKCAKMHIRASAFEKFWITSTAGRPFLRGKGREKGMGGTGERSAMWFYGGWTSLASTLERIATASSGMGQRITIHRLSRCGNDAPLQAVIPNKYFVLMCLRILLNSFNLGELPAD